MFVRITGQARYATFYKRYVRVVIAYVNLKRYEFAFSDDRLEYYFDSIGPKGVIRKVVRFRQDEDSNPIYSLGFGDLDLKTGHADDSVKSNNGDRNIVMATIASIALDFNRIYPDSVIYARGSIKAKTRLYQMAINSHFAEISLMFDVFGHIHGAWEDFRRGVNYEALYIKKKLK
jgi:hypothetical protein